MLQPVKDGMAKAAAEAQVGPLNQNNAPPVVGVNPGAAVTDANYTQRENWALGCAAYANTVPMTLDAIQRMADGVAVLGEAIDRRKPIDKQKKDPDHIAWTKSLTVKKVDLNNKKTAGLGKYNLAQKSLLRAQIAQLHRF